MTSDDALKQLGHECPRKILGFLHAQGHYLHCTSARFPGKILCFNKDSELPGDCELTPAQAHFMDMGHGDATGATG